ncbi:apolipoprotein N-acyltransferase [Prescottella agglutinans]|uniref:Apolipoprotein N-acyltransferase n=1 Tax=Prescottella agglutinans TaxID=1644129 RepID=A0ABT6M6N2_9NOCA|nr:apolipoprotein N-acyltransferase [Prescottella agglutinans]MDH6279962.1 apolipoprotein N-acyltransferase [Prescottella agglutinans]
MSSGASSGRMSTPGNAAPGWMVGATRSRWFPRAAVVTAGALPLLAMPEPNLGVLAWVSLMPVMLLVRAAATMREAGLRGWLAGVGFLAGTQFWVAPNLVWFFPLAVGVLALLWAGWGVLVWDALRAPLTGRRAAAAAVVVPAGWVLVEAVRSWQWLGGPWPLLGATQWQHPGVLGLAALGGVWMVSFAIVASNVGVALCVVGGTAARVVGAVTIAVAVASGPLWSAYRPAPPPADAVVVALVQPGIVHGDMLAFEEQLSRGIRAPVDLIVWGESSVDADPASDPALGARLSALAAATGADLLVNVDAPVGTAGAIAKTSVLIDDHGIRDTYRKTRLVPFGEYVPFRDQLGWLSHVTSAAAQNRQPGDRLIVMNARGVGVGPLISFEETFPDMARTQARAGADLLVYQTSTATFQGSWAPAQLASFGALRAAESGRPVAAAALTGESAAFDARGRLLGSMHADEHGVLRVEVPIHTDDTLYDRLGNYVPGICAAIVAGYVAGAVIRRRTSTPGGERPAGTVAASRSIPRQDHL